MLQEKTCPLPSTPAHGLNDPQGLTKNGFTLRGSDSAVFSFASLLQGNKFCDFLLASPANVALQNWGLLLQEKTHFSGANSFL